MWNGGTLQEWIMGIGALLTSAAGLRLLKHLYKISSEKRKLLRDEAREDLQDQIEETKKELDDLEKRNAKLLEENSKLRTESAVLKERIKNMK